MNQQKLLSEYNSNIKSFFVGVSPSEMTSAMEQIQGYLLTGKIESKLDDYIEVFLMNESMGANASIFE